MGIAESLDQAVQAMSLNGSDVFEFKCLKHHSRCEKSKKGVFAFAREIKNIFPDAGKGFYEIFQILFEIHKSLTGHFAAQERGKCPYIGRDGHGIVIEYDDQVFLRVPGLVKSFKSHSSGHGTVANDRNNLVFFAFQAFGCGYAKASGNGSTAVPGIESIVGAFRRLGKPLMPPWVLKV